MGTDRIRPLYLEGVRENGYSPHSNPYTGRQTAKEAVGTVRTRVPPRAKYGGGDLTRKAVESEPDATGPAERDPRGRVTLALRSLWRF